MRIPFSRPRSASIASAGPLSVGVPLEGTDTVPGLRALERRAAADGIARLLGVAAANGALFYFQLERSQMVSSCSESSDGGNRGLRAFAWKGLTPFDGDALTFFPPSLLPQSFRPSFPRRHPTETKRLRPRPQIHPLQGPLPRPAHLGEPEGGAKEMARVFRGRARAEWKRSSEEQHHEAEEEEGENRRRRRRRHL